MNTHHLRALLENVRQGETPVDSALEQLRHMPFEDLGFAKVDHHRAIRHGMPEVVFGKGKTVDQVVAIATALLARSENLLITRASSEMAVAVTEIAPDTEHFPLSGIVRVWRDRQMHGNGKIAISVPAGANMQQTVVALGNQINEMGISRDRILVASRDAGTGGSQVELNYISYQARTSDCGDWSDDLFYTAENRTASNFGCANQHNMAMMVADPRDLMEPRPMDGANAARRQAVMGNYQAGKVTGADKSADQKTSVSDVGR